MRAGHFEPSEAPFTPDELEFFAEEDQITIIPKITTAEQSADGQPGFLQLISGAPPARLQLSVLRPEGCAQGLCGLKRVHGRPHALLARCHARGGSRNEVAASRAPTGSLMRVRARR